MTKQETARFKVCYPKPQPAQPIIDRLLKSGLRSVTLIRGRMTAQDAWYEIEVVGAPRTVCSLMSLGTA